MTPANILPFEGMMPDIHPTAFIAPGAQVIGNVVIGAESSIWYNCVLRGDIHSIRIGARTNIQDGSIVHITGPRGDHAGFHTEIGDDCLIGHLAIIHGCKLHDRSFVGLGSIVMDGCEVEPDAMLAAGALLTPGKRIPSGQLWAGRPAAYVRDLTPAQIAGNRAAPGHYVEVARRHIAALGG